MPNPPLVYRIGLHANDGRVEFSSVKILAEKIGWQGSMSSFKRSLKDLYQPVSGNPQIEFLSPSRRRQLGEKGATVYAIVIPELVGRSKTKYL